jgi:hypothetical protein
MKEYWFSIIFLCIAGCASAPRGAVSSATAVHAPAKASKFFSEDDVDVVTKSIDLPPNFAELGFHEKQFNPCTHGIRDRSCESQTYMTLNFQLVCRDTNETVEHSNHVLRPFANRAIMLKLGPHRRHTRTGADGLAQMQVVHTSSLRAQMMMLESPPFRLGVRAKELRKLVVPNDWCAE